MEQSGSLEQGSMAQQPRVFISYAGEDWDRFVRGFGEALRARGIDAWVAYWEIAPGDSLVRKIFDEGLTRADAVIIVLSRWSIDKPWVREELDLAKVRQVEERVRLIPVRIDNGAVPAALRATKWVSIKDLESYEPQLNEIVAALLGQHERPALGRPPTYVQPATYAFSGLTQIDNHVLNLICRIALRTDRAKVDLKDLTEEAKAFDLDACQVRESVQVLDEDGYVRAFRTLGGIQNVTVLHAVLDSFAQATRPDYATVEKEILAFIANHGEAPERGFAMVQLPYPEGVPRLVIDGILDEWEARGMFRVKQQWGQQVLITHISPKLKRAMTGL
jgi:hypothetical protein